MSQMSLFEPEKKPVERRAPNQAYIRKHLNAKLRTMRDAVRLPWSEAETQSWEQQFPQLTALLEPEEGAALQAAFEAELTRLRQTEGISLP